MAFPLRGVTQGELADRLVAELPDREALVYPHRGLRLTWAELGARADDLARGLVALGVDPGDHVTLWSDNRPDWIAFQIALARIGAVLVTANVGLQRDEIAYLVRQSRSLVVVCAPGWHGTEYHEHLEGLAPGLPDLRHVVALESPCPDSFVGLDELVERGRAVPLDVVRARTAATRPDDPTNIQYTSGTTGSPKGVVLTHRNIVENAYAFLSRLGATPDDRVLLQVPLFHCFGCVIGALGSMTHGVPIVALERYDPLRALEAIHRERCTLIHGVPTMYLGLLEHPEFARFDCSSLRAGVMGGAVCTEGIMRRVQDELPCPGIVSAFGLTECSPGVSCPAPDDPEEVRLRTVGHAFEGVTWRVTDPASGAEMPVDEAGEVWARGPNVMQGYFEDPDATAAAITPEGWLRTGDLGTRDADGKLRIVGRIKEMIIRGGENVSPAEVEDGVRTHPAVRDAAVFGVPSERLGEEVACAVVLRDGASLEAAELDAFLEGKMARYKRPDRLHLVDALPLTPSGKVRRFELTRRFGDATPG